MLKYGGKGWLLSCESDEVGVDGGVADECCWLWLKLSFLQIDSFLGEGVLFSDELLCVDGASGL